MRINIIEVSSMGEEYKRQYEESKEKMAKELYNQYMRDYRAKNKQKIKEINKRYWMKKAQE